VSRGSQKKRKRELLKKKLRADKKLASVRTKASRVEAELAGTIEKLLDLAEGEKVPDEEVYALRKTGLLGGKLREMIRLMKDDEKIIGGPLTEAQQHAWDAAIRRFRSDPIRAMVWMNFHDGNRKPVRG